MKNDLKIALVQHSVPIALVSGAVFFALAFTLASIVANWSLVGAAVFAAVAFVIGTVGVYIVANNIADTYTLEVSTKEQAVYKHISQVRSMINETRGEEIAKKLAEICTHAADLIKRTREQQPNKLLCVVSGLQDWFGTLNKTLTQYIDVQNNPSYHDAPQLLLKQGRQAFESFDLFLVNSIKTLEKGDNLDFEVAAKMLDAARFSILS